jgi:maltose O-acetyltransferase
LNETEKMFAGKIYIPFCEGMPEARRRAHELCQKYNMIPETDEKSREAVLQELMPDHGEGVYRDSILQFKNRRTGGDPQNRAGRLLCNQRHLRR